MKGKPVKMYSSVRELDFGDDLRLTLLICSEQLDCHFTFDRTFLPPKDKSLLPGWYLFIKFSFKMIIYLMFNL